MKKEEKLNLLKQYYANFLFSVTNKVGGIVANDLKKSVSKIEIEMAGKNWFDEMNQLLEGKLYNLELTEEEMNILQFGYLTKECNVRLIPIGLVRFLDPSVTVYSSFNWLPSTLEKADKDTRLGCLAFGIVPEDKVVEN